MILLASTDTRRRLADSGWATGLDRALTALGRGRRVTRATLAAPLILELASAA